MLHQLEPRHGTPAFVWPASACGAAVPSDEVALPNQPVACQLEMACRPVLVSKCGPSVLKLCCQPVSLTLAAAGVPGLGDKGDQSHAGLWHACDPHRVFACEPHCVFACHGARCSWVGSAFELTTNDARGTDVELLLGSIGGQGEPASLPMAGMLLLEVWANLHLSPVQNNAATAGPLRASE